MPARRRALVATAKLVDVLLLSGALLVARVGGLTQPGSLGELLAWQLQLRDVALMLGVLPLWHLVLAGFGLYRTHRLSSRRSEAIAVLQATGMVTLVVAASEPILYGELHARWLVLTFWTLATVSLLSARMAGRWLLTKLRERGRNLRNVVVVGTNSRAVGFVEFLESRPGLGYRVLGFVDKLGAAGGPLRARCDVVAELDQFPRYLRESVVDEVVITLPLRSFYDECARLVRLCEEQGVTVRFLSDLFPVRFAHTRVERLGETGVITLYTGNMQNWAMLLKRAADVGLSLLALGLLAPLLLTAYVLVRLSSPGPALFVQERVGLGKRRFRMYKFRTMACDAEQRQGEIEHLNEMEGPVFKIRDDPRVTRLGRILRRTSLDELPQLWNVLRGDMSLVGPRPLPVRDYEGFSNDWQRRRFSVRPGLTCLWQVNGRSAVAFDRWMELDMEYIDRWSLWLDFKIFVRTIPRVLRGVGAQ